MDKGHGYGEVEGATFIAWQQYSFKSLLVILIHNLLRKRAPSEKEEHASHIIHGLPTNSSSRLNPLIKWSVLLASRGHDVEGAHIGTQRLQIVRVHFPADSVANSVEEGLFWTDRAGVQLENEPGDFALGIAEVVLTLLEEVQGLLEVLEFLVEGLLELELCPLDPLHECVSNYFLLYILKLLVLILEHFSQSLPKIKLETCQDFEGSWKGILGLLESYGPVLTIRSKIRRESILNIVTLRHNR